MARTSQEWPAAARGFGPLPQPATQMLLLDGLLSSLGANLRVQMRAEIKRLQRELHQKVVFATHDQEEAPSISDWIMVMDQGRVLQGGTPSETYERPATLLSSVKGNR